MTLHPCYPQGKQKAFTVSYDDGRKTDRALLEILNTYQVKGTFHLNYGRMAEPNDQYIPLEEMSEVYRGQEVACHGAWHRFLTHLSPSQQAAELMTDRRGLESWWDAPVTGYSFPFGAVPAGSDQTLQAMGFEYARGTLSRRDFRIPGNFYFWEPTCHHNEDALEAVDEFLKYRSFAELELLYVWGHSIEFERDRKWPVMETLCRRLSGELTVWCATNLQIKRYLQALRSVVASSDGTMLYNPSAETLYYTYSDRLLELKAGQTLFIHETT